MPHRNRVPPNDADHSTHSFQGISTDLPLRAERYHTACSPEVSSPGAEPLPSGAGRIVLVFAQSRPFTFGSRRIDLASQRPLSQSINWTENRHQVSWLITTPEGYRWESSTLIR